MPWTLAKSDETKPRLAEVMYNLTESIMIGASLLAPFMPETADKIAAQLNAPLREMDELDTFGKYVSGTKVTEKPEILFARKDLEEVLKKAEEIRAAQAVANGTPAEEKKEEEPVIDIEAVSYTHLDVYKRQHQYLLFPSKISSVNL